MSPSIVQPKSTFNVGTTTNPKSVNREIEPVTGVRIIEEPSTGIGFQSKVLLLGLIALFHLNISTNQEPGFNSLNQSEASAGIGFQCAVTGDEEGGGLE